MINKSLGEMQGLQIIKINPKIFDNNKFAYRLQENDEIHNTTSSEKISLSSDVLSPL